MILNGMKSGANRWCGDAVDQNAIHARCTFQAPPASLPTTQNPQHLRDDFGGEEGVAAVVGVEAAEEAVFGGEGSGDGGAEVDEGEFFV